MAETPRRPTALVTAAVVVLLVAVLGGGWAGRRYLQQRRIPDNERSADDVLRLLAQLEAQFRSADMDGNGMPDYWTEDVAGLLARFPMAGLSGGRLDRLDELALADPDRPNAAPYRGYWFVPMEFDADGLPYRPNGGSRHPSAFAFVAFPFRPGISGRNNFILNQHGTVFKGFPGDPVPRRWPSDAELRRRWSKGS